MKFEVYVSKYALTDGITKIEVESSHTPSMVVGTGKNKHMYLHGEGREWHRTWESALMRAEEMRKAAIASSIKKTKRLESLEFKRPDGA